MPALASTMSSEQIPPSSPVLGASSSGSPTHRRSRPLPAAAGMGLASGASAVAPPTHQPPGQGEAKTEQQEGDELQQRGRLQVLLPHFQLQEGDAQAS